MEFNRALLAIQMGHKVARKNWIKRGGFEKYWFMYNGIIYRRGFYKDGITEEVQKYDNKLFYNVSMDDWVVTDDDEHVEPGDVDYNDRIHMFSVYATKELRKD